MDALPVHLQDAIHSMAVDLSLKDCLKEMGDVFRKVEEASRTRIVRTVLRSMYTEGGPTRRQVMRFFDRLYAEFDMTPEMFFCIFNNNMKAQFEHVEFGWPL